jgi:hypothetical protein
MMGIVFFPAWIRGDELEILFYLHFSFFVPLLTTLPLDDVMLA